VRRVDVAGRPSLYAFEVDRADLPPLLVLWDHRDALLGEAEAPVPIAWPWSSPTAAAVDTWGDTQRADVRDGVLHRKVSLTPVFVSAEPLC
jgi:hypothetical protein